MNFALYADHVLSDRSDLVAGHMVFAAPRQRREGTLIEYPKSFFPIILIVFLLRSFLVEPFKIPSGSMIPTLRWATSSWSTNSLYGIRHSGGEQENHGNQPAARGEVMVFRYPENPTLDYIKRVVGVPAIASSTATSV